MSDKKYSAKEAAIAVLNRAAELYKNSPLAKSEELKKGDWKKIHDKLEREGYSKESADKIDGSIKAKLAKGEMKKDVPATPPPPPPPAPVESARSMAQTSMRNAFGSGVAKSDSEGHNPDEQADADLGEKVEQEVAQHESQNEDPSHREKGSYKLAKFMGRRDHKRGMQGKEMDKSVEKDMSGGQKRGPEGFPKYQEQAQNEKGVHTPVSGVTQFPGGKGTSKAGDFTKDRYAGKPTFSGKDHPAINEHKKVLSEMQSQPKPKLPG